MKYEQPIGMQQQQFVDHINLLLSNIIVHRFERISKDILRIVMSYENSKGTVSKT